MPARDIIKTYPPLFHDRVSPRRYPAVTVASPAVKYFSTYLKSHPNAIMSSALTMDMKGGVIDMNAGTIINVNTMSFKNSTLSIVLRTDADVSNPVPSGASILIGRDIGNEYLAANLGCIFIGYGIQKLSASYSVGNSICIGFQDAKVGANDAIAIGSGANVESSGNPYIGEHAIAIGTDAYCKTNNTIAIGRLAQATYQSSISIGVAALGNGGFLSTSIGAYSRSYANSSIALGANSRGRFTSSSALGSSVATRVAHETAIRGQSVVSPAASTGQYDVTPLTLDFPLDTDHEIARVDATVTSYDSANSNKWTLIIADKYMFYNDTTATLGVSAGTLTTKDPSASGDTITLTASGTNIRLSFTAGDSSTRRVRPVLIVTYGDS